MREPTWVVGAVGCAGFILFGAAFVSAVFAEGIVIFPVVLAAVAFALFPLLLYRRAGIVGKAAHVAGLAAIIAAVWPPPGPEASRGWVGWFGTAAMVIGSAVFGTAAWRVGERFDAAVWYLAAAALGVGMVSAAVGWDAGETGALFAVPSLWFVLGLRALDPERRASPGTQGHQG